MKRACVLFLSAVLLTAACSSDSKSSSSSSKSSSSGTATSATSSSSAAASSSASSGAAAGAATLATASNAKVGKSILVDSNGKTVYTYAPDGTDTTSKVTGGLRQAWPPVTATGSPTAGTGLDASKIAVFPQSDGGMQVAYNGHLLYTFSGDSKPGDANGQGLGGIWYVLGTDGNKIDTD